MKTFEEKIFDIYKDRIEVTLQSYVGKDNTQEIRDELKVALEEILKEVVAEELSKKVVTNFLKGL
ncbi:MAG: hypothetical protein EBU90_01285 [Proteobacteria bacterium]|nr:hypothetical protein [Pseudomonadota bacterium]NBP12794.1 hypothetical protein [bacterium]